MFCRKCGNEMPDDSVFCGKCGFNQNEQISSSPQSREISTQKDSSPFHDSKSDRSESMYFDHSTKAITIFVMTIAFILVICIIVTMIINGQITELEERYYLYGTQISQLESMRDWNILLDILVICGLLLRCYLTNKNYLRISGDVLDGVCCPPFGFTTTDIYDLKVKDIVAVEAKNNCTLVVTLDKNYVFLIEDAEKAHWIIYKKIHEE